MKWPALLLLAALPVSAQPAQETTVDDLVDMAGDFGLPLFLYARPIHLSLGATVERGATSAPVAELGFLALRVGRRWGRLDLLQLDGSVIGGAGPLDGTVGGTLIHLNAQFLCHDADDGGLRWMWPVGSDLINPPRCKRGERFGYFLELVRLHARMPSDHVALRFAEGGALVDLLGHGRSIEVWRNRLELRLGAAGDVVWFPGGWDAAARGVVGLRAAASTSDRTLRATLDVTWRPNFARIDDQLVDATATLGTFLIPNPDLAVLLGIRGRLGAATTPRMTTNPWADATKPTTVVVDALLEFWWLGT